MHAEVIKFYSDAIRTVLHVYIGIVLINTVYFCGNIMVNRIDFAFLRARRKSAFLLLLDQKLSRFLLAALSSEHN